MNTKKQQRILTGIYCIASVSMLYSSWLFMIHTVASFATFGKEFSSEVSILLILAGMVIGPTTMYTITQTKKLSTTITIWANIVTLCIVILLAMIGFHSTLLAIDWYFGCQQENESACAALAQSYTEGRGVRKSPVKSLHYNERACEFGSLEGCDELTRLNVMRISEKSCHYMNYYCEMYKKECLDGKTYLCDFNYCSFAESACSNE